MNCVVFSITLGLADLLRIVAFFSKKCNLYSLIVCYTSLGSACYTPVRMKNLKNTVIENIGRMKA